MATPALRITPSPAKLRVGIHEGVSFADYRAIDAVNWGSLRLLDESGVAYAYGLAHPREDTVAMRIGRAAHCMVLEPEEFHERYITWEGGVRRGAAWAEFALANADREILTQDEMRQLAFMDDEVYHNPDTRRLLYQKTGRSEVTIIWRDPATGVRCKGRIDRLNRRSFVDFKTTRNIDARLFGQQCYQMLYHGQLAFYQGGLAALGVNVPAKVAAIDNTPPYESVAYAVPDEVLYDGEVLVGRLLTKVRRARGHYGRRYRGEQVLLRPAWAMAEDQDIDTLGIDFTD